MSTWIVKTEEDRKRLGKVILARALPYSAKFTNGVPRTNEQNNLQWLWLAEAAKQGDKTVKEYRAYCKLHIGVPILRAENEEFREKYDRIIRPLDYEKKLELMVEPFDFPVTRLMTTKQETKYLDEVYQHFTGQGFKLTEPGGDGWEV